MEYNLASWSLKSLILVFFLSSAIPVVFGEPKLPCYFIFGDSTLDNGNNNDLNTTAKVNFLPYGVDFPQGPTGRFSNGRNIADVIAELLGFDNYIPPFATARSDILRGVNYASGGAGILDESGSHLGEIISMNEQLLHHQVIISRVAALLGNDIITADYLSKCLYSIGMGNNDYLNNYFVPQFYNSSSLYTPDQFAALLMDTYSAQLQKLYDYGARKLAVFPVGKVGCLPFMLKAYGLNGTSCVEVIQDAAQIFNEKLKMLLHYLNDNLSDANFLYTSSSLASYGNITILSTACCPEAGDGRCLPGAVPCSKREEYMFWDAVHPSEAANIMFGAAAYDNMSPLFANPIDVW